MVYYLPYIESVGFYVHQPLQDIHWVKDFRNATWFESLKEAMKIPADIYLRADIQIHEENSGHSKSPIVEHRRGRYRAHCRNCHRTYGHGQLTRAAAIAKYQQRATDRCETIILVSLRKA